MNRLSTEKRAQIIGLLCEGMSMRAITRLTGVSLNTVLKLLVDLGAACADYQDRTLRNLSCRRLQLDEIWAFCYSKAKNVPDQHIGRFGYGDVWTWTAICADTKLIPSWLVGTRDSDAATTFVSDLASRLANRVQITTDGHKAYLEAVESAFGRDVDYAMLIKVYGQNPDAEHRYSPSECISTHSERITGRPDFDHISTSYAERGNLTLRIHNRRFTRLTNAHSKKVENHGHSVALHLMFYNFARVNQAIRVTPAMEAGVADHVWDLEEIAQLLDQRANEESAA
jgi:IS1 family transposase